MASALPSATVRPIVMATTMNLMCGRAAQATCFTCDVGEVLGSEHGG